MQKTTRFFRMLCVAMIAVMASACIASVVSAANSADSDFSFQFTHNVLYTEGRYKSNASSCYMNYQSGALTYYAKAVGKNSPNNVKTYDCSGGYYYLFTSSHQKRYMYNYVFENGYPYLAISAISDYFGTASGKWSPDSVPQSGVLAPTDYVHN